LTIPRPRYILLQNPPALPTIAVARFAAWIRNARLIIDWHNLGFSILALRLGHGSIITRLARWCELASASSAYAHVCVTKAMANQLKEWNIQGKVVVLYDRPPEHFRRLEPKEIQQFMDYPAKDRPALVVSSTSWTADEDFGILLEALKLYDVSSCKTKLHVIITGKGPLKTHYEEIMHSLDLSKVTIETRWLTMEDYPRLLGSADLGVSLHASSSGLDLPMKVVDMYGCSLPVCALDFACIDELVQNNQTGLLFRTAQELSRHLVVLFTDPKRIQTMRTEIKQSFKKRWRDNWNDLLRPLFSNKSL